VLVPAGLFIPDTRSLGNARRFYPVRDLRSSSLASFGELRSGRAALFDGMRGSELLPGSGPALGRKIAAPFCVAHSNSSVQFIIRMVTKRCLAPGTRIRLGELRHYFSDSTGELEPSGRHRCYKRLRKNVAPPKATSSGDASSPLQITTGGFTSGGLKPKPSIMR
jgi:hypothetical protein